MQGKLVSSQTVQQRYGFENPFKPDPFVKKALKYLPRVGQLLDVGCGEGADTVFFAKKGFAVTALDKNKDYLKRFRRYSQNERLSDISILHRDV
ncbi:MAG TPA: methyltransferase domain-containing protein, partial [Bacteroidota bacterium]|nr:methyltransferase domain-containing protein [Bacteroidota bacterium]